MFSNIQILFKRFALAMVFASLCRLLFFIFNPTFFAFSGWQLVQAFYYGFAYDIAALVYLHGIFCLMHLFPRKVFVKEGFQRTLMWLFFMAQFLYLFFSLVDVAYFPVSGRRSGIEVIDMARETKGLVLKYLIDFWYLLAFLLAFVVLQILLYPRYVAPAKASSTNQPSFFASLLVNVGVLVLLFVGARGGLNLLPLNPFDAARQTQAALIPLVVNTPFNIIISTQQSGLEEKKYFSEAKAAELFPVVHVLPEADSLSKPRNIVLIIVESLGKEYVGFYNKGRGYTPFLDSLMQHSEVFMHAFANGKKSIEGIPSILSSMPSWLTLPYLSSFYQGNTLRSAGAYLQEQGYQTAVYHGGKNGTMSFDNYVALSKGGKYFGRNEYPNKADFDGYWGISDRPYLAYFSKENSAVKGPFFNTVFTLTSHHPYIVPASEYNKFKEGTLPIHKTIAYTDDALRSFFAQASQEPWFAQTSFIITADHSAENEQAYYQTAVGKYEIPLCIFRPNRAEPIKRYQTVSQLDIMQLVLQEAQFNKPFFAFGSGLNNPDSLTCAVQFHDGYYQIIQWPYALNFDGEKAMALFHLTQDSLLTNNLINKPALAQKQLFLTHKIKAIVQTYNQRLISNTTAE